MRIAGRLALQTPSGIMAAPCETQSRLKKDILSFHGCDVVVSAISEAGFEATLALQLEAGALVRLRLPGAGALLARVIDCAKGRLRAEFVNPVSAARLGKTLGMSRFAPQPAYA
ncbi:MAG: hypothetical protein ACKOPR_12125 [Chakrabartia godavariana]